MKLAGLAAVVTGGASGLGEATARSLAGAGMRVAVLDLNEDRAGEVAAAIGGLAICTDVSDGGQVERAFEQARASHGPTRVLVHSAGVGVGMRIVSRAGAPHDPGLWDRVVRINLYGAFHCMRFAAAQMAIAEPVDDDGSRGVIILTASAAGLEGQVGQVAYSAAKGGIIAMTLPAARDLAVIGVRCISIAPGTFETPILKGAREGFVEGLVGHALFPRRAGKADEFAHAVRFACENQQVNGTTIRLDAGMRLPPK